MADVLPFEKRPFLILGPKDADPYPPAMLKAGDIQWSVTSPVEAKILAAFVRTHDEGEL